MRVDVNIWRRAAALFLGLVVATHISSANADTLTTFIYDNGSFTTLNIPLGIDGIVTGINNAGDMVGVYSDGQHQYGFLENNGTFSTISDPLGLSGTRVTGINNRGQIVGIYWANPNGPVYGFVDDGGNFTTISDPASTQGSGLSGINDNGQLIGGYTNASGNGYGFLYENGTFTTMNDPLGYGGDASGINDAGQIVGTFVENGGRAYGFLYDAGTYTTINDPLSDYDIATGINNHGQIIGMYFPPGDSQTVQGFLDDNGTFTTISNSLATGGITLTGINDAGQIVGYYGTITVVPVVPVDEPPSSALIAGSFTLWGLGQAGIALVRRRRLMRRIASPSVTCRSGGATRCKVMCTAARPGCGSRSGYRARTENGWQR